MSESSTPTTEQTSDQAPQLGTARGTVITGHFPGFGYSDITRLLTIAGQAIDLFATDRDLWYSTQGGPRPSSGWVVAAVEEVLRLRATTIGKPNAPSRRRRHLWHRRCAR